MTRQIALLRGINVGGHNSFPKAKQRELAESLGFEDVSVLLQTGNIVFADPGTPPQETARVLHERIAADLGLTVPVVVRTRDELALSLMCIRDSSCRRCRPTLPGWTHSTWTRSRPTSTG